MLCEITVRYPRNLKSDRKSKECIVKTILIIWRNLDLLKFLINALTISKTVHEFYSIKKESVIMKYWNIHLTFWKAKLKKIIFESAYIQVFWAFPEIRTLMFIIVLHLLDGKNRESNPGFAYSKLAKSETCQNSRDPDLFSRLYRH